MCIRDSTKGSGSNLSAVIYGNFADLLIGLYGTLEILVDPYTDFAEGTTGVRPLQTIEIAVRHAESFAAMQDAIALPDCRNVFTRTGKRFGDGLDEAVPLSFGLPCRCISRIAFFLRLKANWLPTRASVSCGIQAKWQSWTTLMALKCCFACTLLALAE